MRIAGRWVADTLDENQLAGETARPTDRVRQGSGFFWLVTRSANGTSSQDQTNPHLGEKTAGGRRPDELPRSERRLAEDAAD
jgi:hypothetical protein